VNCAQRRGRKHGLRVPLLGPNRVTDTELFQKPQHVLRTSAIAEVSPDHGHRYAKCGAPC
jgi:hypothetical protein